MGYYDGDQELARSRAATKKAQQGGDGTDCLPKRQSAVEKLQQKITEEINEANRRSGVK